MSEECIVGKKIPEWFVRSCDECCEGYYVTRSIGKVATEYDLICKECKRAKDEDDIKEALSATQELLRLKELECEQLKSTIDKMQSNYGDNWFDGFLAALDMHNGEYDELDSIKTSTILEMSERAEEEYLDKAKQLLERLG